jgi:mannose-6-phosphate isomerase-like protein (cupin superfamily)
LVHFQSQCDTKEYFELAKGVFLTVFGQSEGILRVDIKTISTINEHETDLQYFVQKGFVTVKIDDNKVLISVGDSIIIPKSIFFCGKSNSN